MISAMISVMISAMISAMIFGHENIRSIASSYSGEERKLHWEPSSYEHYGDYSSDRRWRKPTRMRYYTAVTKSFFSTMCHIFLSEHTDTVNTRQKSRELNKRLPAP